MSNTMPTCPMESCEISVTHRHGTDMNYRPRVNKDKRPTKQREGDQRLPQGGQECVQDLVIAKMQESKRVGVERYGSTLMTFNGRRGIQDIAEEARDLMVYLAQVEREAEADRDTLVQVAEAALRREGFAGFPLAAAGEVVVDAIMGWVVGNRNGTSHG